MMYLNKASARPWHFGGNITVWLLMQEAFQEPQGLCNNIFHDLV